MLLLYILLALLGQQTTVNGQQTPFFESENLKTSESEKSSELRAMSHETFLESEESVNISEICGNEKTNHRLIQKKSEKSREPRAMSHETFLESEESVNISEICGNEKTNHRFTQKKSEKSCEPRAMSNEQKSPNAQGSQHEAQSLKKTVDCCPLTVDYYENQIRLADSLYKNYLPQYNFEEVKAAVMFFDSLRLTTDNSQRTTDLLESENLKISESEKGCEQQTISNETFFETEKSVNISEICGNEKTNHRFTQKKSEKSCEPRAMSHEQKSPNAQGSQHEAQSLKKTVDCCPLTVDYYENQIRLADSLYKNYLPQYNFEEVKAAVMFFDSLRLTTDLLESENLKTSKSEKGCEQRAMSNEQRFRKAQSSQHEAQSTSQVFSFSDSQIQNNVDHHELLKFQNSKILEFLRARAHYYHAVGLTERDDIVGACEHYFIALEIMETETENLKTSKSGKGSEQRAMSHEQKFRNAHSSKLEAQSPDYEKIRFLSLIYTRLGELFLSENYCDLAISKYRKALKYKLLLGESKAVANTYKCLGNSYQLYDMPDSALYYYNKSLETNSEIPNRLDVEKCIAQILFDKGEKDSAYIMIKNNLGMIRNLSVKHSYYGILGSMYYKDLEYDSAIFYFKKCVKSDITNIKHLSAIRLAAIHDSIGDYEKKMYYDNISLKLSEYNMNKGVERGEMQSVYNEYVKRKQERGRLENKRKMSAVIMYFISVSFLLLITITFIIYVLKRKSDKYTNELNKNNDIINQINEEIKRKESEIREYSKIIEDYNESITILKKEIDDKIQLVEKIRNDVKAKEKEIADVNEKIIDKDRIITEKEWTMSYKDGRLRSSGAKIREQERIISIQEKKLKELENTIRDGKSADMNQYLGTTICKRILAETERVQKSKLKSMNIKPLSAKDVAVLRYEANNCLNNFLERIAMKYPDMDNDDQTCICLLLLNLDTTEISSLLSKNYSTIWRRIDNMKIKLDLKQESDIRLFLSKYL